MSRPTNIDTQFSTVEYKGPQRSVFEKVPFTHKMTFNMGELVPVMTYPEIYPGDTFKSKISCVIRTTQFVKPIMDNLFLDIWAFFCPHRLNWEHWAACMGENDSGPWTQTTEYLTPQFTTPAGGVSVNSLACHMGIRPKIANLTFSCWGIRSYVKVYNRFFRDQNYIAPLKEYTDDTDRTCDNDVTELGGKPAKVAKLHDYFTSVLPEPQKAPGGAVTLPLGETAPVIIPNEVSAEKDQATLIFKHSGTGTIAKYQNNLLGLNPNGALDAYGANQGANSLGGDLTIANKMYADLSLANAATLTALRSSITLQQLYELDARTGTRRPDIIFGHFGVVTSDAVLQYPVYLGGKRIPLNIEQVNQTSASTIDSPLANEAAYSLTANVDDLFSKSFEEHGTLLILCAVRQTHTYQQGIPAIFKRRGRLTYYWPVFSHISEQPVKRYEIFATGVEANDNKTFGFKEPWAELHYMPSYVSGEFHSDADQSLDVWTLADYYDSAPVASQEFMEETDVFLKRTLAEQKYNQIRADFLVETTMVRPMPVHCTPGLFKI